MSKIAKIDSPKRKAQRADAQTRRRRSFVRSLKRVRQFRHVTMVAALVSSIRAVFVHSDFRTEATVRSKSEGRRTQRDIRKTVVAYQDAGWPIHFPRISLESVGFLT